MAGKSEAWKAAQRISQRRRWADPELRARHAEQARARMTPERRAELAAQWTEERRAEAAAKWTEEKRAAAAEAGRLGAVEVTFDPREFDPEPFRNRDPDEWQRIADYLRAHEQRLAAV